jgi:DNA topoisomerase-2
VSEISAYHHGEASLQSTIVGLAQDFVGQNNLNLLMPNGQFGTRIGGGHDSASARYIHTELNPLVPYLFRSEDMPLLTYNEDDGHPVEPTYYVPIIPMVLVNGMNGIGTGFSTSLPKFSIHDVVQNIQRRLRGQGYRTIHPSYRGFTGTLVKTRDSTYLSKGTYRILDDRTLEITELPIGRWTDDYKIFLDSLLPEDTKGTKGKSPTQKDVKEKGKGKSTKKKLQWFIKDYVNNSSDTTVHFTITVPTGFIEALQWNEDPHMDGIEEYFKLTTTKGLSLTNIHLYNEKEQITKYQNINEIFDTFYEERYRLYDIRKAHQLREYQTRLTFLGTKIRFIQEVIEEHIVVYRQKQATIVHTLEERGYPKMKNKQESSDGSYEYLLKISLYLFTEDEIEKRATEHAKIKHEYEMLQQRSLTDIWLSECAELLDALKTFHYRS